VSGDRMGGNMTGGGVCGMLVTASLDMALCRMKAFTSSSLKSHSSIQSALNFRSLSVLRLFVM
jgi:hypothetical protein